jgi:hypothetical protein
MKTFYISFISTLFIAISSFAQTTGDLTVTTTTSEYGGNYAPKNIVAIWIENDQGEFVKTLLAYADNRKTHLNTWQESTAAAGTEFNTTDAITGATRSNHGTRTCSWDASDYNGFLVPDGTYYVWMELTDQNGTGNYSSFPFIKSDSPESQTPENVPSFASITIDWVPTGGVSISEIPENNIRVIPNYGSNLVTISGDHIKEIEVRTISGSLVFKGTSREIDLSSQKSGYYLIVVKTENSKVVKKVYKN